jgi:hypothetical protein
VTVADHSAGSEPPHRNWLVRRVGESIATLKTVVNDPHSIVPMLKHGLLAIWRVRGGGFYGLGYVACFVVLEIRMFIGNFDGNSDVVSLVVFEVLEFVFRFTVQSFLNGLLAFIWPAFVLQLLGGWGILAIGAAWLVFDRWGKRRIEAWLPELKSEVVE